MDWMYQIVISIACGGLYAPLCNGARISAVDYTLGKDQSTGASLVPYAPEKIVCAVSKPNGALVLQQWLEDGGDPNAKLARNCSCCGQPLAILLIDDERVDQLCILLDAGLDPNLEWYTESIPVQSLLGYAAKRDAQEVMKLLIDHGTDPHFLNKRNIYPGLFAPDIKKQARARLVKEGIFERYFERITLFKQLMLPWGLGPDVERLILIDIAGLKVHDTISLSGTAPVTEFIAKNT